MPSKDLKVTLLGEDRTGSAFGSAGKNADGLGTKFAGLGKVVGLALGGAAVAGIAGLGAALAQGFKDAASYEKITNQVAQTIKSTGAAAGVSADGLKKYAGELESLSGVDEELILSGQNVLLTFTNIRNAAGKGNDIFDQASEAALNLSTTMGGDLVGANTLVGKALNDPIRGMTALRRAGVQLTDAQQEQIKTMVESGDTMGAQKVLLGELEVQFGGAAKAAGQGLTGSIARAKDAFQDMFRGIATALLPKLTELMQFFADKLMPGIKGIYDLVIGGDFTGALRDAFGWEEDSGIVSFLFGVRDAFIAVGGVVSSVAASFSSGGDEASGSMGKVREAIRSVVEFAGPALESLRGIFQNVVTIITAVWNTFGATILSYFASSWENIKTVLQGALDIIGGILDVFVGVFTGDWSRAWDGVKGIVTGVWDVIKGTIGQAFNIISTAASVFFEAIKAVFSAGWNAVKDGTSAAWNAVTGSVSGAWRSVTGAISSGISTAVSFVAGLPGKMLGALGNMGSLLYNAGKDMIQGLLNGAGSLLRNIGSFFLDKVPGWIKGPFKAALGISSPSKVFAGYGKNIGQGLIDGMGVMQPAVASQMAALADTQSLGSLATLGGRTGAARTVPAGVAAGLGGAVVTAPSRPTIHIDNYNEARQSPHEVAESLTWIGKGR